MEYRVNLKLTDKAFKQVCRQGDAIDVDAPAPAETDDRGVPKTSVTNSK